MKRTFIVSLLTIIIVNALIAQGKYAGSKKSLIGKVYSHSRNLSALKGWTFMEGGVANSINDPELITSDVFKKGTTLATLGDATVNGNYAPHLHFQIIDTISTNFGDYPGVCSASDLDFYLENCPDPNLLLKIH